MTVGTAPLSKIARVTWPDDNRTELVKVFVADGKVRVYAVDPRQRSVVLRREADVASAVTVRSTLTVTTEDGAEWVFRPGGCGCGSPLKSFRP